MENINIALSIFGFLFTSIWAVWTWNQQYQKEQRNKRDKIAALYINPFLVACDQLQSRVYNILELQGLEYLRERYPDGQYAEETLYLIAHFFGWEYYIFRYGPYTRDSEVIDYTNRIRWRFSQDTLNSKLDPFCFRRQEQIDLGKLVVKRVSSDAEVENISLESLTLYEFIQQLSMSPWSDASSIRSTLETLRGAKTVDELEGRKRLAEIHQDLVGLLNYLEQQEGFTLFAPGRKIAKPII
ncbi:MAG: hypothetical protein J7641_17200 [Cyanobacteria bacterium SID2]|nr:hypothetical protein [Cyanobacteria bacterium SID2]MBP0005033.1 hypothetical protein [Cyanobacteria bacterium SBC]